MMMALTTTTMMMAWHITHVNETSQTRYFSCRENILKRTKDKYVVRLSVQECVGAKKDNLINFLPRTAVGEVMETFDPLDFFCIDRGRSFVILCVHITVSGGIVPSGRFFLPEKPAATVSCYLDFSHYLPQAACLSTGYNRENSLCHCPVLPGEEVVTRFMRDSVNALCFLSLP